MPRPQHEIDFDIKTMGLAEHMLETVRNAKLIFEKCYLDALNRLRADLNEEDNCMLDVIRSDKEAEIHFLQVMFGR